MYNPHRWKYTRNRTKQFCSTEKTEASRDEPRLQKSIQEYKKERGEEIDIAAGTERNLYQVLKDQHGGYN